MITIGVTDCSKYGIYEKWVLDYSPEIRTIKLSEHLQNYDDVAQCDGILFTGGEDVHPRFYGKPEYYEFCYETDVSELRDDFDLKLMDLVVANKIPTLGVCRGLQVINVYFGGTLIPDIPIWGKWNHSKLIDNSDRYHGVMIDPNSELYQIIGQANGEINSNHHQAADKVGRGLVANAFSEDGVIEGLEYHNPTDKGFLCLVQWHPERLRDLESPFSKNLIKRFINESRKNLA